MNAETKVALISLCKAVQDLAAGVVQITGVQTAAEVLGAAETAINALNKEPVTTDETH